eukprot:1633504-Rhodomonas_salina.1
MTNDFLPAHVQQWVCEIQQEASRPRASEKAPASAPTQTDFPRTSYNDIEAEVIEGGRRCARVETSEGDEEGQVFARHMFQSKKAHRVACLLASARLIASLSGKTADEAA